MDGILSKLSDIRVSVKSIEKDTIQNTKDLTEHKAGVIELRQHVLKLEKDSYAYHKTVRMISWTLGTLSTGLGLVFLIGKIIPVLLP